VGGRIARRFDHGSFPVFDRAGPTTLAAYAREGYSLLRDVKASTLRQYVIVSDLFTRWAGHDVLLEQLDEKSVSEWLRDYAAKVSPATVRGKKNMILAIWRAAADDGLCEYPISRRVRRVTVPQRPVVAWTKEEVEQLLAAAATLPRWHRCGLRRSDWWSLAIRVAWDSGIRWGDQVTLPVSAVCPDGSVSFTASKTGKVVAFRLSPSTMEALRASLVKCPRTLVLPWPASGETFRDQVDRLVAKAKIRPGTWKWVRRGSGSDVELQQEGAGHRHLGNTRSVFERSYGDAAIIGRRIPSPRELLVKAFQDRENRGGGIQCHSDWPQDEASGGVIHGRDELFDGRPGV